MLTDDERYRLLIGLPLGRDLLPDDDQRFKVEVPERKQCVVLVPTAGAIQPDCEAALQTLERLGYPVWRVRGYSAIDQGRNQLATDALAQGFAETFWIDDDIAFDPADVDRIRCFQLPICGGVYPKKGKRELACHVLPGTTKIAFGRRGCVQEVKYTGTGFLHVRREVYETMQQQLELPTCNLGFGGGGWGLYSNPGPCGGVALSNNSYTRVALARRQCEAAAMFSTQFWPQGSGESGLTF